MKETRGRTMNREELGKRILFDRGEQSNGKGFYGLIHGGDPDFESGVKTYLLREQNRLIEQGLEEERQRQQEIARRQAEQEAVEWILWFAETESQWEPFTNSANVAKLDDNDLYQLYESLGRAKQSLFNARSDAWRAQYERPENVGRITEKSLENAIKERRNRKEAQQTKALGQASVSSLYHFERINWAVENYLGNAFRKDVNTQEQRKEHLSVISNYLDTSVAKLKQVSYALNESTKPIVEKHLQLSIQDVIDEFSRGLQIAHEYNKAKAVCKARADKLWLVSIALLIVLPISPISVDWYIYACLIVGPYAISKGYLEEPIHTTMKQWKAHLEKIGDYGTRATCAFKEIAGPNHPDISELKEIRVPNSPI